MQIADDLLHEMVTEARLVPDAVLYLTVINGFLNASMHDRALDKILEYFKSFDHNKENFKPVDYSQVPFKHMTAKPKFISGDAAFKILKKLKSNFYYDYKQTRGSEYQYAVRKLEELSRS